ncbi:MAG: hypothetical protein HY906_19080 [Deltaproteobacteria bacterium]|nr:hypothetical protein [Deltaproteobacteria bacterium]
MTRVRIGVGAVFLAFLFACTTPARPYGQPEYDLQKIAEYRNVTTRAPQTQSVLVLGALDDLTVSPVGGLYNEENFEYGPLLRTYWYPHLAPKLLDCIHSSFSRRGVRAYKDYLDLGAPVPFPQPTYPPGLVLLRGSIETFGFSRHVQEFDVLIGRLTLRLVEGATGRVLWQGQKEIAFRAPMSNYDPFVMFGDALAAALLEDAGFSAALAGGAR